MVKLKLKGRLIFLVSLLFMLIIILLNFHMSVNFLQFSRMAVEEKLEFNIRSLHLYLEDGINNSKTAALSMAFNPAVVTAIRNKDTREIVRLFSEAHELYRMNFFTVTDQNGIVLARTHESERYGDSITNQQNIHDALNGKVSTLFEEGTAVVVSVRTGAPVYDTDGTLIGVISAGVRFDTPETVKTLSGLLNSDVSIFLGDTRIITTIMQNDELNAEGTTIDPKIAEIVINQKREFTGELNLFGSYYETYYKPLINSRNEVFAIIFLGINIDDIKRESNALFIEVILIGLLCITISLILLNALRNAMQANIAKSAFLSTMSHEIRTPMNAILGITEIQLQKEKIDAEIKEALEKIYISGDMLLGIINDILDLSKIEAGKLELVVGEYEMASLLSDTAQLNMMRIGSKPIEFELSVDENIPAVVSGDELRVKQILNNLLSNAFKYTEKGKVVLHAECCEEFEKGKKDKKLLYLVFKVTDTGQGMTKEQVNKLFEEYARFNMTANRKTEGTGLGMSITRNLVKLMGGTISVKSEPNIGSTFIVRIPQGKIGNDVLGKEMTENLLKFRSSSRSHMKRMQITREIMPYGKVLIVDDVEMNIYVAKGLLAPYRLKIDSAESGFEAIEKIKNGKVYDVVFMDHMMPEMDGIETTKKIRQMNYTAPIVALTANAVSGQAEIFLGNGFDDFISKPIDVRQMNLVLNKFVRDKQPPEVIEEARKLAAAISETDEKANTDLYAEVFVRDALKSISIMETFMENKNNLSDDDLRKYIIHVHGMKSALANLGEMELSAIAMKLESSGRTASANRQGENAATEDIKGLLEQTPAFLESLKKIVERLSLEEESEDIELTNDDKNYLHDSLFKIKDACSEYNESDADEIITELKQKKWPKEIKELINSVSEHLLHSDFEHAAEIIDKYTSN